MNCRYVTSVMPGWARWPNRDTRDFTHVGMSARPDATAMKSPCRIGSISVAQPMGSIDLLTAQARYARAGSAGVASCASRAPWIAGGAVADSALTSCRADATAHARKALLLICRGGQRAGTAAWGFNSVSWGSTRLSWSSGPVCETAAAVRKNAGQQRQPPHRAFLMNKRSEAAAAVRPDPAAPSRLTILADFRSSQSWASQASR